MTRDDPRSRTTRNRETRKTERGKKGLRKGRRIPEMMYESVPERVWSECQGMDGWRESMESMETTGTCQKKDPQARGEAYLHSTLRGVRSTGVPPGVRGVSEVRTEAYYATRISNTAYFCDLQPATSYLLLAVSSLFSHTQSPSPSLRSVGCSKVAAVWQVVPGPGPGPGPAETRPERSAQR